MVKKKAIAATRKSSKKKDVWTREEQAVFAALGIGEGEAALRKFIRGQRKINGRLYEAIDVILVHLKKQSKSVSPELIRAEKLNDALGGGEGGLWGEPDTDAD